jgi:hypothetical protein
MDNAEARGIISSQLAQYREWTYPQLCAMVGAAERTLEVVGRSGTRYQVEIYAFWDSEPERNIRVICHVDDGGWRAFIPLSGSFIKAPNGSFVGES